MKTYGFYEKYKRKNGYKQPGTQPNHGKAEFYVLDTFVEKVIYFTVSYMTYQTGSCSKMYYKKKLKKIS